MFLCICAEDTGQVKNCLGECSLKVTRPDGECSKILVSNPVLIFKARITHASLFISRFKVLADNLRLCLPVFVLFRYSNY